jgi:hypothetical protein
MKYRSFVQAGIAVLTLASSHAFAQATKAYEHGVTLTLTEYSEGEVKETNSVNSSREVNTEKSTFVTSKFSNKQFLDGLVEDGLISSISGWSLKLIVSQEGGLPVLYIVKKGTDPIDVSDYIGFETYDVVEEYSETETEFTNGNFTDKGTWNERGYSEVFVDVPGFDTMLDGAYYSKHSYSYEDNVVQEFEKEDVKLLSANLYSFVGVNTDTEDEIESFVEGSAAVGSGKLVDFIISNPE